ncbi:hypothetical protein [Polaribacter glomeratus]|uniref:BioF2-like acetyltransferase domain-containing protein n=1 Tax=Polaribacter glomeratus TaxID=102 RepID=A0A2S7WYJ3_9FLAO|nr:hypothetical protein [Polaribacter glomeratus]PQJ82586.1 hypothetical protein BTO16_08360 [Polaribacter glomeratus]TXD64958.1 hypothetical protein ESX12_12505 [Polaribacter glomeratus]
MITYIRRKELDVTKYDACIESAVQSRIYAFSWYLDIVADNWDVLVLDDYKAVMPITWRKKMGIKYVYPPFWLLELGVFSLDENKEIQPFLEILYSKFKFAELRLNTENKFLKSENLIDKQFQYLDLKIGYEPILKGYNRNRKREIVKANKHHLVENWTDNPEKLITIFKVNIAERVKGISENDYSNLLNLMNFAIEKGVGELLTIYDANNKLLAAAFFLKHKKRVTQLVCASDISNRKNGVHTFFNDRAIFKYQPDFNEYNFGGSSMENIANYYLSFGSKTEGYQQVKYNNLPFFIKLFKK